MNKWMEIDDKVSEAKEAVKQLEDLKKRTENSIMRIKHLCVKSDGTFEKDKEALDFAIDFIKWRIGGKML